MDAYRQKIRRLNLAVNRIDGIYYQLSKILGEKDNLICLLYALDDGKPHSQKQLCEEWLIPKTTINTIVKELAAEGFLLLIIEEHTREKRICLTPKGRRYASSLLSPVYRMEQEALRRTLQEHGSAFIEANAAFARNLKESFDRFFARPADPEDSGEQKADPEKDGK